MFGLSIGEIIFLGILGLLVIGPKQLPEVARNIGRFLNELRRVTDGFTRELRDQTRVNFDLYNDQHQHQHQPPPPVPQDPPPLPPHEGDTHVVETTEKTDKKDDQGNPT